MTRRRFLLTAAGVLVPALPKVVAAQGPFVAMRLKTTKPPFGTAQINWGHPLAFGLSSCLLLNEGGGLLLNDFVYSAGASYAREGTPATEFQWLPTVRGIGLVIDGDGTGTLEIEYQGSGVPITANSNFSDFWVADITALAGGNPGLWRSGALNDGDHFHIFQGGNNRVWVRWAGSDILLPGAGTALTTGMHSEGISLVSGSRVTEYIDGVQTQTATHAVATGSRTINALGWQAASTDSVRGRYILFYCWSRALSSTEFLWLHAEPYAFLQPIPAVTYAFMRTPAAPAAGVTPLRTLMGVGR